MTRRGCWSIPWTALGWSLLTEMLPANRATKGPPEQRRTGPSAAEMAEADRDNWEDLLQDGATALRHGELQDDHMEEEEGHLLSRSPLLCTIISDTKVHPEIFFGSYFLISEIYLWIM